MRSYLLATTPRTGSEWLCARLTAAGLGQPGEQLRWRRAAEEWSPVVLHASWWVYAAGGVYGLKWFAEPDLGAGPVELDDVLPPGPRAFVWLRRADQIAQARSLAIARRYGGWDGHGDRSLAVTPGQLARARNDITEANEAWRVWFADLDLDPLCVSFEDSLADPDAVVERIVHHVHHCAQPTGSAPLPTPIPVPRRRRGRR